MSVGAGGASKRSPRTEGLRLPLLSLSGAAVGGGGVRLRLRVRFMPTGGGGVIGRPSKASLFCVFDDGGVEGCFDFGGGLDGGGGVFDREPTRKIKIDHQQQ